MDDITLSYTDDYSLRTYTATLQCSVSYSTDRERLATSAVDEEYLICAALIDRIGDKVYDYSRLKEILRSIQEAQNRLEPSSSAATLIDDAVYGLTTILSMSSRLTSKQKIHQLLQGGTNGPASYYDQRHAVQSLTRTTPRVYQQAGDTVSELNAWIPGTSTTGQDDRVDAYRYSQVHI